MYKQLKPNDDPRIRNNASNSTHQNNGAKSSKVLPNSTVGQKPK